LIVIDNADNLTWGVNKIIPKGKQRNVIITNRDNQSSRLFNNKSERFRVHIIKPSETNALFLKYLELDIDSAPLKVQGTSSTIVDRLGYLALAVNLAGAYISEKPNREAASKQYLADYDRHQDALL
jgi:hypothetical protein